MGNIVSSGRFVEKKALALLSPVDLLFGQHFPSASSSFPMNLLNISKHIVVADWCQSVCYQTIRLRRRNCCRRFVTTSRVAFSNFVPRPLELVIMTYLSVLLQHFCS